MIGCKVFVISNFFHAMSWLSLARPEHLLARQRWRILRLFTVIDLGLQVVLQVCNGTYIGTVFHHKFKLPFLVFCQLEFALRLEELFVELIGIVQSNFRLHGREIGFCLLNAFIRLCIRLLNHCHV